jgi:Protein of unknown function (DUF2892)
MKANEGVVDRVIRVLAGIGILSLYFVLEGPSRNWALIGAVPLLTGLMGYCPVYSLFGFNTCPVKPNR